MVRSINPSCIFLQETKIEDSRVVKLVENWVLFTTAVSQLWEQLVVSVWVGKKG